jgi:hypothetical protein
MMRWLVVAFLTFQTIVFSKESNDTNEGYLCSIRVFELPTAKIEELGIQWKAAGRVDFQHKRSFTIDIGMIDPNVAQRIEYSSNLVVGAEYAYIIGRASKIEYRLATEIDKSTENGHVCRQLELREINKNLFSLVVIDNMIVKRPQLDLAATATTGSGVSIPLSIDNGSFSAVRMTSSNPRLSTIVLIRVFQPETHGQVFDNSEFVRRRTSKAQSSRLENR